MENVSEEVMVTEESSTTQEWCGIDYRDLSSLEVETALRSGRGASAFAVSRAVVHLFGTLSAPDDQGHYHGREIGPFDMQTDELISSGPLKGKKLSAFRSALSGLAKKAGWPIERLEKDKRIVMNYRSDIYIKDNQKWLRVIRLH